MKRVVNKQFIIDLLKIYLDYLILMYNRHIKFIPFAIQFILPSKNNFKNFMNIL